MSNKRNNLIWGLVLIVLGSLMLVETLGLVPDLSQVFWAAAFALVSLFFVSAYFYGGREQWAWLIPASVTGGLALVTALSLTTIGGPWLGALFMASVSAPFWLIYLFNRQDNWWALIPGWVTAVVTLIILIPERWAAEIVGTLVMWSIALPFFLVYLRNRAHWWALIPGFIVGGMGFIVLLATQTQNPGQVIGSIVMLIVALPFLAVFFLGKGQWWAIIPAGILTTLALLIPFASAVEGSAFGGRLVAMALFLGIAVPFAWLWHRRDLYPTDWAKYPALILSAVAILTFALGSVLENGWPIILIVIGAWLLYQNLRQPRLKT